MKQELLIAGVIGLIAGVLIAPSFSPIMGGMWGNSIYSNQMGYQKTVQIDRHFIEQMIPHHEDAVTMANLALAKAEHPEIKTLASDIISAQTAEIDDMKSWYKSWFGQDVPDYGGVVGHGGGMMMHMGIMGDSTDYSRLQTAKPFDKAFIENMIPHHQMAVMMAQMLLGSTDRPEMKQLANNIIDSQTKEINQMREWYRSWYSK